MSIKLSLKWSLLLLFCVAIFSYLIIGLPANGSNINIVSIVQQEIGLPIRLRIPNINVDASIEHLSHTSLGAMDAPQSPDNAGWYNLGPRPGEVGSAVIDGHSGYKNNKLAIFDNLHKLRIGDKIYVEDDKEKTFTFMVREIRNYDPKADATDVFISNDGKIHLNLITCEGIWNEVTKSRSNRLVVFADKE